MQRKRSLFRAALIIAAAVVALIYQNYGGNLLGGGGPDAASGGVDDAVKIAQAFEAQQSDLWVQSGGTVERSLKDDREGSQHQRFIVRLANGHSVLIAHNIDLAPRVPLQTGDRVRFRGEFEWNPRGGVVHWTHHDPRGKKIGGWIVHEDKTYK